MADESRYPIAPVLELAHMTPHRFAEHLGVHSRQVYRWKTKGLTWTSADRVAVSIGLHPVYIWPEWADRCDAC